VTVTDSMTQLTGLPTLADVAHLAGVSSATASRVLTGSARVRPQTKDKVEQAMTRLGYVRNRAARSPASRRAGSIALVLGEETIKVFGDPFFARVLRSVSKELSSADSQLVMLTLHSPHDYQTVSRYLRSGHVDGALFVSMHHRPDFDYESLGIPVVLCGRPAASGGALSYVDADNIGGASAAVRYLLGSGRKAIATIAGPPDMAPGIDRLIDLRPGIDAVFAASDLMAAGALHALRRLGKRVPHDVAVIGFDDLPAAQQTDPQLTTVRQPVDAMGTHMVSEILARIADPEREPSHVVLGTQLIQRGSA
jgi:DNA-binding LacI/PurR family transcriptional regulator